MTRDTFFNSGAVMTEVYNEIFSLSGVETQTQGVTKH